MSQQTKRIKELFGYARTLTKEQGVGVMAARAAGFFKRRFFGKRARYLPAAENSIVTTHLTSFSKLEVSYIPQSLVSLDSGRVIWNIPCDADTTGPSLEPLPLTSFSALSRAFWAAASSSRILSDSNPV